MHIEIGLNPIQWDSKDCVIASIVDITERRMLERRFRLAVEAASNSMIIVDQSGKILDYQLPAMNGLEVLYSLAKKMCHASAVIILSHHSDEDLAVRDADILCRMGGDEFAILIQDVQNPSMIRYMAHRILESFQKSFSIENRDLYVSASIGIATFPDCANDPTQLMKCADIAMYRSKEEGRNQINFYSKAVHQEVVKRITLERDLKAAVKNKEFVLFYQPQINCADSSIAGVEALIRWQHPTKGLLSPQDFIPIAEESGVIHEIGDWVFETVCKQFEKWLGQFISKRIT